MPDERLLREEVVAAARGLRARGLTAGKSGNVSSRLGDGLLVTPSGVAYDVLSAEHIVRLDASGTPATGSLLPSSEWPPEDNVLNDLRETARNISRELGATAWPPAPLNLS